MTVTIGVDIGGSSVTAVAIDPAGRIVDRYRATASVEGGHQMAAAAVTAVRALDIARCDAVGIGVPGQVDPKTGQVTMAVNLGIGTDPYNLAGQIGAALDLPVTVENDVRAAAFGAFQQLQAGEAGPESLVLVGIGTGISAGAVVRGELVRGANGMAGEIGHVVVDESGPVCRCGQRGCLEVVAAGPAIARSWPRDAAGTAATALFAAAAGGDPAAEKVADRIAGHLTTALIWLAAAYDAEQIMLAGGVTDAGAPFLDTIRDQITRRGAASELAARRLRPGQVTLADPDNPPGPRGAALLAANRLLRGRVAPAETKAGKHT